MTESIAPPKKKRSVRLEAFLKLAPDIAKAGLGFVGIVIGLLGIIWAFSQIPGPAAYHPPPLPRHVIAVGPENTFLVERGYTPLGKFLCKNGEYEAKGIPE